MKRFLSLVVAVAFALSFAAVAVAAEKPAAAPAAPAKAEPAKKAVKAKSKQVTGTIESLDAAAGTFSVKGKKETVGLKAGEKVKLGEFAVGEKVLVKYSEGTASSVKKVPEKKAAPKAGTKAAAPKAEKKEAAPAAPAAK